MKIEQRSIVRGGLLTIFLAILCAGAAFAASTEFVIHTFRHTAAPILGGCSPNGDLVGDADGNLYGAGACGAHSIGSVFKLTRPVAPSTAWTSSVLYSFTGFGDGGFPQGGLIFDGAGNLYGTTGSGGAHGWGTVFELSPPAAGETDWTESVLYSFQGGTTDGEMPQSGPIWDAAGNLYGVTYQGGQTDGGQCRVGCGIVYELSPPATAGGAWTETVLHYFAGPQGSTPRGTLVFDARGDLYGTTEGGGKFGDGLVFRLTPPAAGATFWTYKILYAFSGLPDGVSPWGGLKIHGKGVLYGTTIAGGGGPCASGCGTVFQLVPPAVAGGVWTETVIHTFTGGSDGVSPTTDLVFDSAGNIYGTTPAGGGAGSFECSGESAGCGVVFELSPPAAGGSTWTETILHAFPSSASDAFEPSGGLIFGKNGVLFGGTSLGAGTNGQGAVYGVVK